MEPVSVGLWGCVLLVLLLFLGMPITFAMMLVGFLGISTLASVQAALPILATTIYGTVSYYAFTIIPLFILMGGLAENPAIATMVAMPNPPGNLLNHLSKLSYSSRVMPAFSANPPIKINNGMMVNA